MSKQAKQSIRVSLYYVIFSFGIIISLVFIVMGSWLVVRDTTSQVKQTLILETQRTDSKMGDYYLKLKQVIEHLSMLSLFSDSDLNNETRLALTGEIEKARCSFGLLAAYFGIESDGSLLNYPVPEGFDSRKRIWYQMAVEKGSTCISDPYKDITTGTLVTAIAKPILGKNGRIGVIGIDSSLQGIVKLVFSKSELFESTVNLVLSSDGRIVIIEDETLVGKTFPLDSRTGDNVQSITFNEKKYLASIIENKETGFWIVSLISPNEILFPVIRLIVFLLIIVGLILFVFILAMNKIIQKIIVDPIIEIASDMKQIQALNLDGTLSLSSHTYEIWLMQTSMENMKKGLRSFRKYVPSDVVNILLKEDTEASLGAEKRDLTIMFSDIANFTSLSERFSPDSLAVHLGYYFKGMTSILQKNQATVDKYIGDAIMSFWGAPLPLENHARFACKAALECLDFLAETRKEGIHPDFQTRIGINTGESIVGNMGYEKRMSYTAIGDPVNTASRFEGLNKFYGTNVLISETTWELVKNDFVFREIDTVVVKGKSVGLKVFELLDYNNRVSKSMESWLEKYAHAMESYHNQEWKKALTEFEALYDPAHPDKVLEILLKRIRDFVQNPPPEDWNGEIWLRGK